jgi:hypothetical protein
LLKGDWKGVTSGKEFEKRYCYLSRRKPRSLKGSEWGILLAEYAMKKPLRADNKKERPIITHVCMGAGCKNSSL